MKKDSETTILEFEVIAPTNDLEKVGEKLELSKFGEYCPENSLRGYNLLFLLDHTMHYRISKIMMKGKVYGIPSDRKKNYITDMHPNSLKFKREILRYSTEPARLTPDSQGAYVMYETVKHLF